MTGVCDQHTPKMSQLDPLSDTNTTRTHSIMDKHTENPSIYYKYQIYVIMKTKLNKTTLHTGLESNSGVEMCAKYKPVGG